jgi:hypothetical protein
VFESVVTCAGEHEIGASELFEVAQTLKLGRVQDAKKKRLQRDLTARKHTAKHAKVGDSTSGRQDE